MTLYAVNRAELEIGEPCAVILHLVCGADESLMLRTPIDEAHMDRMHQILDGLDIGRRDFWELGAVLETKADELMLHRGISVPIVAIGDYELAGRTLEWPPT